MNLGKGEARSEAQKYGCYLQVVLHNRSQATESSILLNSESQGDEMLLNSEAATTPDPDA